MWPILANVRLGSGESFESMLRRFGKQVETDRILAEDSAAQILREAQRYQKEEGSGQEAQEFALTCAMGLQDKLRDDLKVALKQRDAVRLLIIRVLLAECRNEEKARMHLLDEAETIDVLGREARRRNETVDAFRAGNRRTLFEEQEAVWLSSKSISPHPMSHDDVVMLAKQAIANVGAVGLKDKGKVMSHLMPSVRGKADGKDVNEVVTGLLSAM